MDIKTVRERSRRETFEYIQSMSRELRDMANGLRDDQLTYFLELAYFEVSDRIRDMVSKETGKAA